jgi:hypothetical protein
MLELQTKSLIHSYICISRSIAPSLAILMKGIIIIVIIIIAPTMPQCPETMPKQPSQP